MYVFSVKVGFVAGRVVGYTSFNGKGGFQFITLNIVYFKDLYAMYCSIRKKTTISQYNANEFL